MTMRRRPSTTTTSALLLLLILIATKAMAADPSPTYSHNITAILSEYPRFSIFNHHLTTTGLADVINNRAEVTVCALDNSAMSDLLALHPTPASLRRILLFNLFSHYSGPEELASCCAWTLYPSPFGAGDEVVDQRGIDGNTYFTDPFTSMYSRLLGIIHQIPAHLSLLHVSKPLPSPELRSLTSPVEALKNMTSVGCGEFSRAVAEVFTAERWFRENAYVGMTVICPVDAAWERFISKFQAMDEDEKVDLLLFHAIPVYYGKFDMSWDLRPKTLTSYYRWNDAFGELAVNLAAVRRLIAGVGFDEGGPLAIYPIEGVLVPDDSVGVVDYSDPNAPTKRSELVTEEECWELGRWPRSFAPAPTPGPSMVAEDVEADQVKLV